MNTLGVVVGLGIAGAVIALVTSWRRGDSPSEMGVVSHQWIAEHQLGPEQDSRR